MKRKIWMILLVFSVLLSSCSLWSGTEPHEETQQARFYYYDLSQDYGTELGTLSWEQRDLGTEILPINQILELYLAGPVTEDLQALFPDMLTLKKVELQDGILTVTTDETLLQLSGVRRTMAAAALVQTMTQFTDIDAVCLRTEAGALSGVLAGPLTAEDFLLYDDSGVSDLVTVKLYFSDASGRHLVAETRSRSFNSDSEIPNYILRQLLAGPQDKGGIHTLPEGTVLLGTDVEDGVCTVNLSEAFVDNRPDTHMQARMTVFSVVNSLTELSDVECVRFLCVNEPITDYCGLDLSKPMYREEPALGLIRNTDYDVTFYVPCGDNEQLAPVPVCIRRTSRSILAEDVLSSLISFKPANGYENAIPDGTTEVDMFINDGQCQVTLNSAFALCDSDPHQAEQAVRSIVATLCQLEEIDCVQIILDNNKLTSVDLSKPISVDPQWLME